MKVGTVDLGAGPLELCYYCSLARKIWSGCWASKLMTWPHQLSDEIIASLYVKSRTVKPKDLKPETCVLCRGKESPLIFQPRSVTSVVGTAGWLDFNSICTQSACYVDFWLEHQLQASSGRSEPPTLSERERKVASWQADMSGSGEKTVLAREMFSVSCRCPTKR